MKPPPFEYLRPDTLEQALQWLAETENAKLLAGGQSLMAMLNLRYLFPDALIDLNRLPELADLAQHEGAVRIGAMVRQRTLEYSPLIQAELPILIAALKHVGHRQTRNRGTIGGSLCHLDPSGELPTITLLYDAELEIASVVGRRRTAMRDFIAGYLTVNLAPDEMLIGIEITPWSEHHGHAFLEFARRHGDFAIASAACLVETNANGLVSRIALAAGGVGEVPLRLDAAEAMLIGTDAAPDLIERAASTVLDLPALEDIHADPDYRHHVAFTLTKRAINHAMMVATPADHVAEANP